jgi:hypothetical protein
MRTGQWLTVTVLLCLLGATVWYVVRVWMQTPRMATHGYVAVGLGTVVALALGFGLMALMFYSNRKGYDDSAHKDQRRHK